MGAGHMWSQERTLEAKPDATPEQWATWARIVREQAPDLAEMVGVEV